MYPFKINVSDNGLNDDIVKGLVARVKLEFRSQPFTVSFNEGYNIPMIRATIGSNYNIIFPESAGYCIKMIAQIFADHFVKSLKQLYCNQLFFLFVYRFFQNLIKGCHDVLNLDFHVLLARRQFFALSYFFDLQFGKGVSFYGGC